MKCLKDLLVKYQIDDVRPMLVGIENMLQHYKEKGVCIFKECVSLAGVSKCLMRRSASKSGSYFPLFNKLSSDLEELFKKDIQGGLSIIQSRYEKIGQTFIRNNPNKVCNSIIGLNANSLYSYALSGEFTTGQFLRRFSTNSFKIEPRADRHFDMYIYFEYISKTENVEIQHKLSRNKEFKIGPYYVDGYIQVKREILEFAGCFFHFCKCINYKKFKPDLVKIMIKRRLHMNDKIRFLTHLNYKGRVMWECTHKKLLISNKELRDFAKTRMPKFSQKYSYTVTQEQILDGVRSGEFVGFVECYIEIPDQLPSYLNSNLSSEVYFDDYPPVFVMSTVKFYQMSPVMQQHILTQGLSKALRKALLSGLRAKKVLLCSSLLKWYLEHSMHVTKIYQVVENNFFK